ncbi:50S ribosomal protein L28 [Candidatus Microgenomates bacterium]|nr:50S ribosomal protein L28 [Candidatus Microgenomates bacterium]
MSKVCEMCGKTRTSGSNVSHSNRHTRRVFNPNLQKATLVVDGVKIQTKICTTCIKTRGKSKKNKK